MANKSKNFIDTYELQELVGAGTQAQVYRTLSPAGEPLALKLFYPNPDTRNDLSSIIKTECKILKQLSHPGIGKLIDFGKDKTSERYYLVTEFISGKDLLSACKGQAFSKVEDYFVQTLRALNYLHSKKITHADLKPANIRVNENGEVKLLDFGFAGIKNHEALVGTPAYMAPELIFGFPANSKSDLYSLAITFYECLSGVNPFASTSLGDSLNLQQHLIPTPLHKLNPKIPVYFSELIAQLMQKNPGDRRSSCLHVLRYLKQQSTANISVETTATCQSYLPSETALIGRKAPLDYFESALRNNARQLVLIIDGDSGMGKTRLLKELYFIAQLSDRKAKWHQMGTAIDLNTQILFCDDASVSEIQNLKLQLLDAPTWIVASTQENPQDIPGQHFNLTPFNLEEISEYISQLSDLKKPPQKICEQLLKLSMGNPLYLSQILSELTDQLFDASGKINQNCLDDYGFDPSIISLSEQLSSVLAKTFAKLDKTSAELLAFIALHPEPTAINLIDNKSDDWLRLRELGFIKQNHGFVELDNLLLKKYLCENYPTKAALHQRWTKLLPQDNLLLHYHAGRAANNHQASQHLLHSAEQYFNIQNFNAAKQEINLILQGQADAATTAEALFLQGCIDEKLQHYATALSTFEKLYEQLPSLSKNNPTWKFKLLERMGLTFLRAEQIEKAKAALHYAHALVEENKLGLAKKILVQNYLARIKVKEGALDEAANLYQESLVLNASLPEAEQQFITNHDLGNVYLLQGKYAQALAQLKQELAFFEKYQLGPLAARAWYNLGETQFALRNFSETIACFKQCVSLAKEHLQFEVLLRSYNGLANVLGEQNQLDESLSYYQRALRIAENTRDIQSQIAIAINMAIIQNKLNQLNEALVLLNDTIKLIKKIATRSAYEENFLIRAYLEAAEIFLKQNKWEDCRDYLRDALNLTQENKLHQPLIFWVKLTQLKYAQARPDEAMAADLKIELTHLASSPAEQQELDHILANNHQPQLAEPENNPEEDLMANEYEKLMSILKLINSEKNLDFVLRSILHHALEITHAERALILLLNEHDKLEIKASLNLQIDDQVTEISTSIAQRVLNSGQLLKTDNAFEDERFNAYQSVMAMKLRSILCIPIYSRGKTIGLIYLDNKFRSNVFSTYNQKLLEALCDQAGIAIDNAQLFAKYEASQLLLEKQLDSALQEKDQIQKQYVQNSGNFPQYQNIIAASHAMQDVFRLMDKITNTTLATYIHGETGSGKELIAKALHNGNNSRKDKRFVAINCGAIPENLLESELFGHKAGAFTGATRDKIGLFVEAHGGTLFLDEVADLPLNLQVKLLRVLEEGEVMPVGSTQIHKVDVRIVCASHKDLEKLIGETKFREDLFYRLCQIKIELPPLRARPEDIPLLADKFVSDYCKKNKIPKAPLLSPNLLKRMMEYEWPGNVRELENVIHVSCALSGGKMLGFDNLPAHLQSKFKNIIPSNGETNPNARKYLIDAHNEYDPSLPWDEYERRIVAKAHAYSEHDPNKTAKVLDLSVATVYKKVKEFGLSNNQAVIYQNPFEYNPGLNMRDYLKAVVKAAHQASGEKPYTAIKWLKISQGHYYKILKELE